MCGACKWIWYQHFPEAMVREYLAVSCEEAHQTVREARIKSYAQVMKQMYERNMQQVQLNRQTPQQNQHDSSKLALELDPVEGGSGRQLYAVGLNWRKPNPQSKALEDFPIWILSNGYRS